MISVSRVVKSYGSGTAQVRALDDVTMTVKKGEIFGVVGQSGAGKSTLIRTINSLEQPDSGTVHVGGRDMTSWPAAELRQARHDIGMIFQHFNLLSGRTVRANVELSLEITGAGRGSAAEPGAGDPRTRGSARQGGRVSRPAVGRAEAARRHRPRAGIQPVRAAQ